MTNLSAPPTLDEAPNPAGRRRKRWILGSVVGLVVALVVAYVGWIVLAGRVADKVDARWDLDCDAGTMGSYDGEPAIRSRPGWKCDVALTIRNESGRDIRVRRVVSPFLGSRGGAEIQGFATDDADLSDGDDADAVWRVDLEIPAHASRTITLAIGWRQNGCNSGGAQSLEGWPTIELEALGRTFEHQPEQRLMLRTFDDRHDRGNCIT